MLSKLYIPKNDPTYFPFLYNINKLCFSSFNSLFIPASFASFCTHLFFTTNLGTFTTFTFLYLVFNSNINSLFSGSKPCRSTKTTKLFLDPFNLFISSHTIAFSCSSPFFGN